MAIQRHSKTIRGANSGTTLLCGGNPKIANADGDPPHAALALVH